MIGTTASEILALAYNDCDELDADQALSPWEKATLFEKDARELAKTFGDFDDLIPRTRMATIVEHRTGSNPAGIKVKEEDFIYG